MLATCSTCVFRVERGILLLLNPTFINNGNLLNQLEVFRSTCVAGKLIHQDTLALNPLAHVRAQHQRHTITAPRSGLEVNNGDSDAVALSNTLLLPAVSPGVVTAVVFISVCALAAISRLLYQQRRAQRSGGGANGGSGSNGGGGGGIKDDNRHSMYTDYRTELHLHNSVRDNMKEYYI